MFEFESESNQTAPPRTVPHGPTGQQLPANLFRLAAHTQPMPPTPSALGLLATAYRCGDRPSPSLVPPHGAPHHWNPSGFSLTSPALKGHHAPLLQVSHPAPPFSAQEARATLPLTALPPVHPARCCRSTGKKSKPLLPLQPPHGEIKPSSIVVLRYRPLLTPRPTPPPSCCWTHRSSLPTTGARLLPSTAAASTGLRPRCRPTSTMSFRLPLLARCHPTTRSSFRGKPCRWSTTATPSASAPPRHHARKSDMVIALYVRASAGTWATSTAGLGQ
jgi:hypothetical protein